MNELLQHIDAIIAAQDFPTALTGHDDLGRALEALAKESNAPFVCVTLGAEGSLARCGGREIRTRGGPGAVYVDVSVPGRPVAGTNSRLSGRG